MAIVAPTLGEWRPRTSRGTQRASAGFNPEIRIPKSEKAMILPLRQRHRRVFAVLSVLLLVAFTAGLVTRKRIPTTVTLPPELLPRTQTFTATDYERDDLFEKSPVKVRLWKDLSTGQLAIGFLAPKDFLRPDLMAYWVAARPQAANALPPDAVLLGSFVATVLVLPAEATKTEGTLILFSLADQEIVDVSKPTRFSQPMK